MGDGESLVISNVLFAEEIGEYILLVDFQARNAN